MQFGKYRWYVFCLLHTRSTCRHFVAGMFEPHRSLVFADGFFFLFVFICMGQCSSMMMVMVVVFWCIWFDVARVRESGCNFAKTDEKQRCMFKDEVDGRCCCCCYDCLYSFPPPLFFSLSVLALSSTPIGWVCESFFCFFIFCYSFFICFPFFSVFFSTFVLLRVYPASTSRSIHTLTCSVSIFPSFFWLALVCQRSLCMLMCVRVCGIIYMPVLHKSTHISLSLYTHTRTLSLVHTLRHLDSVARGYCLLLLL